MMNGRYQHTDQAHNLKAPQQVVPIVMKLLHPKSVLDVGCGTGTWLKVFEENGLVDFLGLDGDYVNESQLRIPRENFKPLNLEKPFNLHRRFDMAICLEVAEHLPVNSAEILIKSLVAHSDEILFSAAIPGQEGQNHLNEQSPDYWAEKFEKEGYYFHDIIRPLIWDNPEVDWWYRQNIFLVRNHPPAHRSNDLFRVHPELFYLNRNYLKRIVAGEYGIMFSANIFFRSVKKRFEKWFHNF